MFQVLENTLRLMAPILPFTTDEAWEAMPDFRDKAGSVHLCSFPEDRRPWLEPEWMKKVERLLEVRELVQKRWRKPGKLD